MFPTYTKIFELSVIEKKMCINLLYSSPLTTFRRRSLRQAPTRLYNQFTFQSSRPARLYVFNVYIF